MKPSKYTDNTDLQYNIEENYLFQGRSAPNESYPYSKLDVKIDLRALIFLKTMLWLNFAKCRVASRLLLADSKYILAAPDLCSGASRGCIKTMHT